MGEALVGNEAVDQLVKFNRALIDYADSNDQSPRGIDGIVLTKFDTIDDKVHVWLIEVILYLTPPPSSRLVLLLVWPILLVNQ